MRTDKYGGVDRGRIQAGRIIPTALPWLCRPLVGGVNFFSLDPSGSCIEICEAAHMPPGEMPCALGPVEKNMHATPY